MIQLPINPMLLKKSKFIIKNSKYIHQLKFDGFRCLMQYTNGQIRLYSRHQNECTWQFKEFHNMVMPKVHDFILDGEMVVFDDNGHPDFEAVMERYNSNRHAKQPANFVAFDILSLNGELLTSLPLKQRIEILNNAIPPTGNLMVCPSFKNGEQLFDFASKRRLEGIVSKHEDSRYILDKRSPYWLKTKNYDFTNVYISGIRKGDFAWSLVDENKKYIGLMEFVPQRAKKALRGISKQITLKEDKKWVYLEPVVICKVKHQGFYKKKRTLRSPSFVEFLFMK